MMNRMPWNAVLGAAVVVLLCLLLGGYVAEIKPAKASAAVTSAVGKVTAGRVPPTGLATITHWSYLPLLTSGRPDATSPVVTIAADVTDNNNNERMAFVAADTVRTHLLVNNSSNGVVRVQGNWKVLDESGSLVSPLTWGGELDVQPGSSWWFTEGAIPAGTPAGSYTFIGSITFDGETSTQTGGFYVASTLRFTDDFSNPSSRWSTSDTTDYAYGYADGEYRILFRTAGWVIHPTGSDTQAGDFAVEADVHRVADTNDAYGLMFCMSDNGQQYDAILVDQVGNFTVARYADSSGWSYLYPWSPGARIRSADQLNHVAVARSGARIFVYANGRLLAQVSDSQMPKSCWQGLIAESWQDNAEVRFDNFRFYTVGGVAGAAEKPAIPNRTGDQATTERATSSRSPLGRQDVQGNREIPRHSVNAR